MDREKVVNLRQEGYSYGEIMEEVPNLTKSTISGWLKNVALSESQSTRLKRKMITRGEIGRLKGAWTNKEKAAKRIDAISEKAKSEFADLVTNRLFIMGLMLYWAEGAKTSRRFAFINSDPDVVRIIMRWLRELFGLSDDDILVRIYIHHVYKNEDCEQYWSEVIGIPVSKFYRTTYKPTPHDTKRNKAYKGCCRIEVRGSELFWKVQAWQKMIANM
ncbi:MAG: hypothetical protein Q8Q05_04020 [bacterium]|nr:hypothetical protein [bacterium]